MAFCPPKNLAFVPVSLFFFLLVTLGISYMIAVLNGDVAKIFPYISDTGGKPPESCIFSQFVNLSSLGLLILVFIRYKEVDTIEGLPPRQVATLNKVALAMGILSAAGLSMVGNFQDTEMVYVHETGAALLFFSASLYSILHTRVTYLLWPEYCGLLTCTVRLVLTALLTVSSVLCTVFKVIAAIQWAQHPHPKDTQAHWKPRDGGYTFHVISAAFEWALAVTFGLFCLSFATEFRHVSLELAVLRRSEPFPAIDGRHDDGPHDNNPHDDKRVPPDELTPLYA